MELGNPIGVITPTLDAAVLRVLANATAEFTGGDVRRILGYGSATGVRLVLERLTDQGIANRREAGRAYLYSLNRQHLAADAVIELASLRSTLFGRIRDALDAWDTRPVYAAVFGSAVRSDHQPSSDIDLFIVRPNGVNETSWDQAVSALATSITAWTGNDTRPFEMAESDVLASVGKDPVLTAIASEGMTLAGSTHWLTDTIRRALSAQRKGASRK